MRKQIKKYGNTLVITFTKNDQKLYNISKGQIYDVEIALIKEENLEQ